MVVPTKNLDFRFGLEEGFCLGLVQLNKLSHRKIQEDIFRASGDPRSRDFAVDHY